MWGRSYVPAPAAKEGAMARGAWGRERPGHNPLLWPEGGGTEEKNRSCR